MSQLITDLQNQLANARMRTSDLGLVPMAGSTRQVSGGIQLTGNPAIDMMFNMVATPFLQSLSKDMLGVDIVPKSTDGVGGSLDLAMQGRQNAAINAARKRASADFTATLSDTLGIDPAVAGGGMFAADIAGMFVPAVRSTINEISGGDRRLAAAQLRGLGIQLGRQAGTPVQMFTRSGEINNDALMQGYGAGDNVYDTLMRRNFGVTQNAEGEDVYGLTQETDFSRGFDINQQTDVIRYLSGRNAAINGRGDRFRGASAEQQVEATGKYLDTLSVLGDIMKSDDQRELLRQAEQFTQGDFTNVNPDKFSKNLKRMAAVARVMNVDGTDFAQTVAQIQKDMPAAVGLGIGGNVNALGDVNGRVQGAFGSMEYALGAAEDVYGAAYASGDMSRENVERLRKNQAAVTAKYHSSPAGRQAMLMTHLNATGRITDATYAAYTQAVEDGSTYGMRDLFDSALASSGMGRAAGHSLTQSDAAMAELAKAKELTPEQAREMMTRSYQAQTTEYMQRATEIRAGQLHGEARRMQRDFFGGYEDAAVTRDDMDAAEKASMVATLRDKGENALADALEAQGGGRQGVANLLSSEAFRDLKPDLAVAAARGAAGELSGALDDRPDIFKAKNVLDASMRMRSDDPARQSSISSARRALKEAIASGDSRAIERAKQGLMDAVEPGQRGLLAKQDNTDRQQARVKSLTREADALATTQEYDKADSVVRAQVAGRTGMTTEQMDALLELQGGGEQLVDLADQIFGATSARDKSHEARLKARQGSLERLGAYLGGDDNMSLANVLGFDIVESGKKGAGGVTQRQYEALAAATSAEDIDAIGLTDEQAAAAKKVLSEKNAYDRAAASNGTAESSSAGKPGGEVSANPSNRSGSAVPNGEDLTASIRAGLEGLSITIHMGDNELQGEITAA